MQAEFEEKTYENYFNTALDRNSEIFFPLGQVQEGNLGFDASSVFRNRKLWRQLGYPFWLRPGLKGLELRKIADEMEHFLSIEIDNIPQMKANLLFQYKRPEFITISSGKEWPHWNQPYYRYNIYKKQHDLLMHIHSKFNAQLHVIYASPSTIEINELVKVRKQIIENSNFAKAVDLHGHHRNTYVSSGTYSIACSEPEEIENINILEFLGSLSEEATNTDVMSNREFVINFSSKFKNIVSEYAHFSQAFNELNEDISEIEEYRLLYSFLVMQHYRQLTGNQWLIKI